MHSIDCLPCYPCYVLLLLKSHTLYYFRHLFRLGPRRSAFRIAVGGVINRPDAVHVTQPAAVPKHWRNVKSQRDNTEN